MRNFKFQITNFKSGKKLLFFSVAVFFALVFFAGLRFVLAGEPGGNDWFEILTSHQTGLDNTGDGGTGSVQDLNYYYVGQSFTGNIKINSDTGSNAANIWVDYNTTKLSAGSLQTGTFFSNWSGQSISGGRIKSTGYRTLGYSTGLGNFGSVNFTAIAPTNASYGVGDPTRIDINTGVIGATTESNISRDGLDILDDAEDFQIHIWADTRKPYAEDPGPANGSSSVAVEGNYLFSLKDTKNGEGDDTGVGTGVNTSSGSISMNDGSLSSSYNPYVFYGCSGVWGTNVCNATVNPGSPSGISGDQRNWKYATTYTANISGFRDLASASQDQLGDPNGPNTMDTKVWTFTTEADTMRPQLSEESPSRGSTSNSVSTNISFSILDKKTYPGSISGSGVDASTCKINISSPTFLLTTLQQGDPEVSVSNIDYGVEFTINPATDFGQNETVSVSVYDCEDQAGNSMVTENYSFTTLDSDSPYVEDLDPADDTGISSDGTISFHIKDSGTGVDLDSAVIYANGVYYTRNGGAGSVTSTGTKIEFSSSLSFEGGNYLGDTTEITGTFGDYAFLIDPEDDFTSGEAIPISIYARDIAGNLMESFSYALIVDGGGSCNGEDYCGSNTNWNGSLCVGSGGGGGGCSYPPGSNYCGENTEWTGSLCVGKVTLGEDFCGENTEWNGEMCVAKQKGMIYNETVTQVDETSVLVTWYSAEKGDTQLYYDERSFGASQIEFYSYEVRSNIGVEYYHSVLVSDLETGTPYHFRPVSKIKGKDYPGVELNMSPKFVTETKETIKEVVVERIIPGVCPAVPGAETPTPAPSPGQPQSPVTQVLTGASIRKTTFAGDSIVFQGVTKPFTKVKISIIDENE